jgi:hypothetical protein
MRSTIGIILLLPVGTVGWEINLEKILKIFNALKTVNYEPT